MQILITGIHGFVGTNLVLTLNQQHHLHGLDIVSPKKEGIFNTYSWNEIDQIPNIDVVIHLAGKAHDTRKQTTEKEYFDINVELTQKVFDFFLDSSASKFIFFSSVKAVADMVIRDQLTEAEEPNPTTPYGRSKLQAEQYILREFERWSEGEGVKWRLGDKETGRNGEGIDKKVYILRPCMIHGPGNKGNLNLLYTFQQKGLPWPLGAFENKRSFCSIDNVSFVVQQLIEKEIETGIYQLADDEAMSTNELIRLIAASQNKKAKIWQIPARLIRSFARLGDFLHLPLNNEHLKKLTESYIVSNRKLKLALGIERMPFTAVEGLQKTFGSFRNNAFDKK